jgi:uncharacterized membrane protein
MLLGAGVLLFVAAHWDVLPPASRFALVVSMILSFHVAAAWLRARFDVLGQVLHGVGTVALGAGIFLAGQIFHLQELWPGGVMLWAAGAWLAWLLLRDRIQAVFCALLTPAWLSGEWIEATADLSRANALLGEGMWLLALAYLGARTLDRDGPVRCDLVRIGGLALIPLTIWVIVARGTEPERSVLPAGLELALLAVVYGGPLALAFAWRGRAGWMVLVAACWLRLLGATAETSLARGASFSWRMVSVYVLCAIGSAPMAWWGLFEGRRERVNLAVTGFGLTVVFFYFHNVMDKFGRSLSLMGLGLLFVLGGYALARTRRRLLEEVAEVAP